MQEVREVGNPKKYGGRRQTQEDIIIAKLDLMRNCKREIVKWVRLVKRKDFAVNLNAQNEAALIARGTCIKVESLKVAEKFFAREDKPFAELLKQMANDYGHIWNKQTIALVGADGGPIEHKHSGIIELMDRKALQDAIAARRKPTVAK